MSCTCEVTILTDYKNVLFTFHAIAVKPNSGRHKLLKVIRWALYSSAFSYTIEQVLDELNILAHVTTLWMEATVNEMQQSKLLVLG